ncbi:MAG: hypothetical protein B6I28_03675 [Fusobacteriia bacterium 4572_132]|nr:MAG: hypothetical protein B6I28_03675 [Fusobacteriia bacterium 4572_132]
MNSKYKVKKDFEIPLLDEDGVPTEEYVTIKKGEIYSYDGTYTLCGAELRITNENGFFLEINRDSLERDFNKIK